MFVNMFHVTAILFADIHYSIRVLGIGLYSQSLAVLERGYFSSLPFVNSKTKLLKFVLFKFTNGS